MTKTNLENSPDDPIIEDEIDQKEGQNLCKSEEKKLEEDKNDDQVDDILEVAAELNQDQSNTGEGDQEIEPIDVQDILNRVEDITVDFKKSLDDLNPHAKKSMLTTLAQFFQIMKSNSSTNEYKINLTNRILTKVTEQKSAELVQMLEAIGFAQTSESIYEATHPELVTAVLKDSEFINHLKNTS